jgi:hypothetical protein
MPLLGPAAPWLPELFMDPPDGDEFPVPMPELPELFPPMPLFE